MKLLPLLLVVALAPVIAGAETQLIDQTLTLKPKEVQGVTFHLNERHRVGFGARGVANTALGFRTRLLPGGLWADYQQKRRTLKEIDQLLERRGVDTWGYIRTDSYSSAGPIEPGDWALVIENGRNLKEAIQVRVTCVLDVPNYRKNKKWR